MNLVTWSIRKPIPALLLFVLLAVAGMWGFHNLPIQDIPDLDLPAVSIILTEPGAAPAQLETEIARRVENSLATLSGLKHLTTSITDGQVAITAQFILQKHLSDAVIESRNAVDRVRTDLPGDMQDPTVSAVNVAGDATLLYSVSSSKMDQEALSWFVDNTVNKAVLGVLGVGKFDRVGGADREIRVQVDPVRLASLGITAGDVSQALRQQQQEASGGRGQVGNEEQSMHTIATVQQASDLAAFPISLSGGRTLRLDQIATIHDTTAEHTQAALLDGEPVVGFKVYSAKGADETRVAAGVRAALQNLQVADPTLHFIKVSGSVDDTLNQYNASMRMLYEGALLTILVVWGFLRDWRATLIAATALPLSILPTFAAMYWLGYSLNTVTLLALTAVVGVLVDDAIVEIENIERHRKMGKSVKDAVSYAVSEIALAVLATTMSLVAVFLPTAFMSGIPGLFFREFGWTAAIAVLSSLLVARFLTPMLAAYFLSSGDKSTDGKAVPDGRVMRGYMATIRWCLAHRLLTGAFALTFFAASLALATHISSGAFPASDRGFTNVSIELPPGSSLQNTLDASENARLTLHDVPGIAHVFTTVGVAQQAGLGAQAAGEVRDATMTLVLIPRTQRISQVAIENIASTRLQGVPGIRFTMGGGGLGEKVQLLLASDEDGALNTSSLALARQLRGVPGLFNISSTASLERPEIIIRPAIDRAAELGVTTASIGQMVRIATSGDFDAQDARLNLDNRQVYIKVRVADSVRRNLDTLANLRVNGANGAVPLSSVADISIGSGPSQIDRYDRQRYVTVSADLGGVALGKALAAAKSLPAVRNLPSSVKLIQTGDAEFQQELISGFGTAIVIGILSVFCVMVLLFQDFLQPMAILSAIPLSLGGAFVALLVMHSEIDISSLIGFVMLTGIVTKNSILLIEYTVVGRRDHGLSLEHALIDACHKRARPIVMTTMAMIAGMLPLAFGPGADGSFRQPMAFAVMGGLCTSTMLSLLVVPVVYTYVDSFERLAGKLFRQRRPVIGVGAAQSSNFTTI